MRETTVSKLLATLETTVKASPLCSMILEPPSISSYAEPTGTGAVLIK